MTQTLSVVIATKDRFELLKRCVQSIFRQTVLPDEIVIVDASTEQDLAEPIAGLFQNVNKPVLRYLKSKPSLTAQNNRGASESRGDLLTFLDDDTFLDDRYIEYVKEFFADHAAENVGALSCKILDPDSHHAPTKHTLSVNNLLSKAFLLQSTGDGRFKPSGLPTFVDAAESEVKRVEFIYGGSATYPRSVFQEEPFDEDLPFGFNLSDDDIAYRISRKHQNYWTPKAFLYHKSHYVNNDRFDKSRSFIICHFYLRDKNYPNDVLHRCAFSWSILGRFVLESFLSLKAGNLSGLKGTWSGLLAVWLKESHRVKKDIAGGTATPRVVIFHHGITGSGGSERITLEEEKYFNQRGIQTTVLSFFYDPAVFNGAYHPNVRLLPNITNGFFWMKLAKKFLALRGAIREINPDIILGSGEGACVYLYCATLWTKHRYSAHIPQTIFWDLETYGNAFDITPFLLGRYSRIFRSVYKEIRESTIGHRESLPETPPRMSYRKKFLAEILGYATYVGVRKAYRLFVLSNLMAWEVQKMYKREAIVLRGAYPQSLTLYKRRKQPLAALGLKQSAKIVLSVCRLTQKKRVDLILRAFALLCERRTDAALVIGGSGTVEQELRNLAHELRLDGKAFFAGFIHEDDLPDYYASCDVFVSADHADYDIATYMALGFNKKVVWTTENETEEYLVGKNIVFPAEVSPASFAEAMGTALDSKPTGTVDAQVYSWENYFGTVLDRLKN